MSSANVGNLNVQLNLEIGRLQSQIDNANARIRSMGKKMNSDILGAAKGITASFKAIAYAAPVAAIAGVAKQVIDLGGRIADLSAQTGISVESFQALANTAELSGVDANQLAHAMVTLKKNVQEAHEGNKALAKSFADLGLSVKYLRGLAPEKQLEAVGRSIANAKDPAAAFNDALDLLGTKNAPRLLEVLKKLGVEGFDVLKEKQKGSIISAEQIAIIDEAGDKLTQIKNTLLALAAKTFVVAVEVANPKSVNYGALSSATKNINFTPSSGDGPNFSSGVDDARVETRIAQKAALDESFKARQLALEKEAEIEEQQRERIINNIRKASEEKRETWEKDQKIFEQIREQTEQTFAKNEEDAAKKSIELEEKKNEARAAIYRKIMDDGLKAQEEELEQQRKLADQISSMWENIADRASDRLTDMILDGKAQFSDFAAEIGRMIAQMLIRMAIINPIINSIGGFFGAPASSALPSFYADGGRPKPGKPAIVGEEGPELWIPDSAGTVIPHGKSMAMMSGGGGGGVTYNIDARGADASKIEELKQMLSALNQSIEPRSVAAIRNARLRGMAT